MKKRRKNLEAKTEKAKGHMEGRALDFIGVEGDLMGQRVRIVSDGNANSPQSLTVRHMCSLP